MADGKGCICMAYSSSECGCCQNHAPYSPAYHQARDIGRIVNEALNRPQTKGPSA